MSTDRLCIRLYNRVSRDLEFFWTVGDICISISVREMADLVLDRDVRDWVLLPLTLVIFLMMLIRQYATSVSRNYQYESSSKPFLRWLIDTKPFEGIFFNAHCR